MGSRMLRITIALALAAPSVLVQAAQVCRDDIAATTPDSRFNDNGNGTLTDLTTGLVWKRCVEGSSGADCAAGNAATFSWQQALQQADAAADAGYSDWRLPTKNELASLVERRCYGPAINASRFPGTPAAAHWSSSPAASHPAYAWYVDFYYGTVSYYLKYDARHVRLVRDGQ